MRRAGRAALVFLAVLTAADLLAWGLHTAWRRHGMAELQPVARQIEALRGQVAEDDAWLSRNTRVAEGYAQHEEYARRLSLRGRRARTHDILVDDYNARVSALYRRFYLAPSPPPPSLHGHVGPAPGRR